MISYFLTTYVGLSLLAAFTTNCTSVVKAPDLGSPTKVVRYFMQLKSVVQTFMRVASRGADVDVV